MNDSEIWLATPSRNIKLNLQLRIFICLESFSLKYAKISSCTPDVVDIYQSIVFLTEFKNLLNQTNVMKLTYQTYSSCSSSYSMEGTKMLVAKN